MFIGMGPIKVLVFYLAAIHDASPADRPPGRVPRGRSATSPRSGLARRRRPADAAAPFRRRADRRRRDRPARLRHPDGPRPEPRSARSRRRPRRAADAGHLPDGRTAHPEPARASPRPRSSRPRRRPFGDLGSSPRRPRHRAPRPARPLARSTGRTPIRAERRPVVLEQLLGSCSRASRSSSSSSDSAGSGSSTRRLTGPHARAGARPREPHARTRPSCRADLGLVEVRPLLARGPGRHGHALAIAGGLGRARPVRLGQHRVEGRDVRLDRGRDDVRAAGLAAVLARSRARRRCPAARSGR